MFLEFLDSHETNAFEKARGLYMENNCKQYIGDLMSRKDCSQQD